MALSWHQYPSGQLAVLVPVIVLAVHGLTHPGFIRSTGWRLAIVALGLAGWFTGYPLAHWLGSGQVDNIGGYLGKLGPRVAEVGADSVTSPLMHLLANTGNLISGIFVGIPVRHHQTFVPRVSGDLTDTSLPWFIAVFAVIGLCSLIARLPAPPTVVTLALIVTAAAPSVFSNIAFVKRAAVLYPVLSIVAAVGMVTLTRTLTAIFGTRGRRTAVALLVGGAVAWACIACEQWFSDQQYDWGTPSELAVAEEVRRHLAPGTIVVADFWHNYMEGKMTYLLLDDLQNPEVEPVAWYVNNPHSDLWPRLEQHPLAAIEALRTRPWYVRWSDLDRRTDALLATPDWQRVIYLFQDDADENRIEDERTRQRMARLAAICPNALVRVLDLGKGSRHRFRLVVCDDHPGLRLRR
jgi:hypothetical protein